MKVVFRYSESTSGPIIKPQWPLVFDLIDDPVEEWDLIEKRLDCAWVIAAGVHGCLERSRRVRLATRTSSRVKSSPATNDKRDRRLCKEAIIHQVSEAREGESMATTMSGTTTPDSVNTRIGSRRHA